MKELALAILLIFTLVSCHKISDPAAGNAELIGSWTDPQYSDTLITYSRVNSLIENQYGITFKNNNKLVERQNRGFCGTPPITTADYEGTYIFNDSLVIF